MEYRYETHLHTCESSRCAVSSGVEFARHFASLGYSGIFVTDHFLNLSQTAGSDIHDISQRRLCGVTCSRRLADGRDYVRALKAGEPRSSTWPGPEGK